MPKQRPFFSIVMPCYGVEPYLRRAVDCILRQTDQDFELILVDDCSKDGTGILAEELAQDDDRISVIHHEKNRGLSSARNTGTEKACGQYILYMDPDDTVDDNLLALARSSAEENPAKLILFGVQEEYYHSDGTFDYRHVIKPEAHQYRTANELRPEMITLERETLYGYAWNKFYSLDYIREHELRFETVPLIEDILFNVMFCMDIESMNTICAAPYHYAKRSQNSLTNRFVPEYFKLHRKRIRIQYEQQLYWGTLDAETKSTLGSLYARYILSALERNCDKRAGMNHRRRVIWCRELYQDELFGSLISDARAQDSRMLSLWLSILKKRQTACCLAMGRMVYIVRRSLPGFYSKVKSGR